MPLTENRPPPDVEVKLRVLEEELLQLGPVQTRQVLPLLFHPSILEPDLFVYFIFVLIISSYYKYISSQGFRDIMI
jgi:hypothetical protein